MPLLRIIPLLILAVVFAGCGKPAEEAGPRPSPAPSEVPAGAPPAGGGEGVVRGSISLAGDLPAQEAVVMTADPACVKSHGPAQPVSEALLVNAEKRIQNAFVYVKAGLEGRSFPVPAAPAVLDQNGCRYIPHVLGVQVRQPLRIVNSDATLHNVHAMPANQPQFNLGMPIPNMKFDRRFDVPEVMVRFKCDVHPWMSAYVGVLPHPFFAVTGADGSFEISGLPSGVYTLAVWHEKLGTLEQTVTVAGAGPVNVDFTF